MFVYFPTALYACQSRQMGVKMNIETLQYFLYTAKYKNITKAAKHFYTSQSTLSRNIIALENELGVRLFERSNKQIELTEAGEVFYKDCEPFINHMDTIIKDVQSADKGNSGILRITSTSNLGPVLSEPLDVQRERYPGVRLVLEAYDFNEIPSAINHSLYNIGLTYDFAASDYEDLQSIPIGTEDFSLVLSSKLCNDSENETITNVVKSLPLILPAHVEPPFLKSILYNLQNLADTKNIPTIPVNTTESVMLGASQGLGYGIVPASWVTNKNYNNNISSIRLENFSAKCKIVMLYKKSNTSEIVNNFVNIMKDLYVKE